MTEQYRAIERAIDAAIAELEELDANGHVIADLIEQREALRDLAQAHDPGLMPTETRI